MKYIQIGFVVIGIIWGNVILPRVIGDSTPAKVGNLALTASQQPGPLISFGQTIVDKGEVLIFCNPFITRGQNQKIDDAVLYISTTPIEYFAVTLNFPIRIKSTIDGVRTEGLGDISVDLEHAYFFKSTSRTTTTCSIFGNVSFPTGVTNFTFGSPTYFMGLIFSHLTPEWFTFASTGARVTTSCHRTQYGNEFLYQGGVGHNINLPTKKWIFLWLVELDGIAAQYDTIKGVEDKNSGGNVIYVTPSLWLSNSFTDMQFGISIPCVQHLRGNQNKISYVLSWIFGFTF